MKIKKILSASVIIALMIVLLSGCAISDEADVFVYNGNIYTMAANNTKVEAMAIKNGKIIYTGSYDEKYIGADTEKIDLQGKTVVPGLIEAHSHPAYEAQKEVANCIQLDKNLTLEENKNIVKAYLDFHPDAEFVMAQGYAIDNSDEFGPGDYPDHTFLDDISSTVPILLIDESLHQGLMNIACMELLGINSQTIDPNPGSVFYSRYEGTNEPTGYFNDLTFNITENIPYIADNNKKMKESLKRLIGVYNSYGYTGLFDADNGDKLLAMPLLSELQDEEELTLIWQECVLGDINKTPEENLDKIKENDSKYTKGNLYCNVQKMFMDGGDDLTMIAFTGGHKPFYDKETLTNIIRATLSGGYAVHVHCIGNEAQKVVLEAYKETKDINPDIPRATAHNMIWSDETKELYYELKDNTYCNFEPNWNINDGWLKDISDEIGMDFMPLKDATYYGGKITLGCDSPASNNLSTLNPFVQLFNAVNMGTNSVDKVSALKGYTIWAAEQMGISERCGSLENGKDGNFIILDKNYFECPNEEVESIKVLNTYFMGKEVYNAYPDKS